MLYKARRYRRPLFGLSEPHEINIKMTKINQVHAFAHEAYMSLKRLLFWYDEDKRASNTLKNYITTANKWLKLWHIARIEYNPSDTEKIITIDGIADWMEQHPIDYTDRYYYTYGDYKWITKRSESFLPKDLTELLKEPAQINTQLAQCFWQQLAQRRQLLQMLSSTTRLEQL